jgi:predicted metalloprotease with PDZ domain
MSGELWLAEGFTNYYGSLATTRAGVASFDAFVANLEDTLNAVIQSPGRRVRSAVEMSRMAPFVDAAVWNDRTDFASSYLSYYTWGEAIASGLDLTLRQRSGGRVTLDDFMRALWTRFGRPGGRTPGVVDRPYTLADVEATLAAVAGDAAFAHDFFARFIAGHDVVDYAELLAQAGLVLRPAFATRGFAGLMLQDTVGGARIADPLRADTPAHRAGLDVGVVITHIGGQPVSSAGQVADVIASTTPGTRLSVEGTVRGEPIAVTLDVAADPRLEIVPVERTGATLSESQRRFRAAWLGSAVRDR